MIGIYKITNPNGKIYIGQSVNIKKRFNNYRWLCNSRNQIILNRSFKKYGIENHNFEIIEECLIENLNERERYWQEYYSVISSQNLNCKLTSTDFKKGMVSELTKKKISMGNKGKKRSETHINILKSNWLGRKHSKESIDKMKKNNARANLGKKFSLETRMKISKNNKKHHSKLVLNIETGIFYDSIKEASLTTNFKYEYVKTNLNGTTLKNKTKFILI